MVSLRKATDAPIQTPVQKHAEALIKRVRDAGQPTAMILPTAVRSYGSRSPVTREVRKMVFGR